MRGTCRLRRKRALPFFVAVLCSTTCVKKSGGQLQPYYVQKNGLFIDSLSANKTSASAVVASRESAQGSCFHFLSRVEEVILNPQQKFWRDELFFPRKQNGVFRAHQDGQRGGCCPPTAATSALQRDTVYHRPPPAFLGERGGQLPAGPAASQKRRCHWEEVSGGPHRYRLELEVFKLKRARFNAS